MVEAIHAHLLSALPLTPIDAAKELEALGFYWCIMGHGASLSGTEVAPPYFHHKQLKPGEHWRQSMRKRHMRVANKLAMRNEPLAGIPSDVWSLLTTANISGKLTPKQERILKHSGAVVDPKSSLCRGGRAEFGNEEMVGYGINGQELYSHERSILLTMHMQWSHVWL